MTEIDLVRLNFNPQSLWALNAIIGLVMFGVALDLKVADFKAVLVMPKPVLIGLAGQFLLLPAFTFLLVMVIKPAPSIALGMMLVAACPGGNISNFLAHHAKGNTALSITMTAISTAVAIVMTPTNIAFWGGLNPETAAILKEVALDPVDMLLTVFLLLGLPMAAGMWTGYRYPRFVERAHKPVKIFSIVVFGLFVVGALAANWRYFLDFVGFVVFAVFLHNALALEHRLFRRQIRRSARARPPRGFHRSRHPEFGAGPDPDFQFLRRPRRHGHRHRLVGHLAHHFRADGGHDLEPLTAGRRRMRSQQCDSPWFKQTFRHDPS